MRQRLGVPRQNSAPKPPSFRYNPTRPTITPFATTSSFRALDVVVVVVFVSFFGRFLDAICLEFLLGDSEFEKKAEQNTSEKLKPALVQSVSFSK